MQILLATVLATLGAAAAVPYQEYILAPPSRIIRPTSVYLSRGSLSSEHALLDGQVSSGRSLTLDKFNSSVTYDFGKNVGGWINFNTTSSSGSVGFTFAESSIWVSSEWCDATLAAGVTLDTPLVFNITGAGQYSPPLEKERGAFRYITVINLGEDPLSINDLWVHFAAMPHWEEDALRSYTGWFHSNDEKLNRVWYAGAYTNQLVTIDPTRGNAIVQIPAGLNLSVPVSARDSLAAFTFTPDPDWTLNTTITKGTSVLVDGGKRDRLVWSGDMAISLPSIAVTTYDLISAQNALDSLFNLQYTSGQFPYAGFPTNLGHVTSFTYHLYALIGIGTVYQWSGDRAYVAGKWARWKTGMEWGVGQIDATGLANVSAADALDWARQGMGGHNIAANALLFRTLTVGAELARTQGDSAIGERWTRLAARIQAAAIPLLWQPDVGLFRDNETTTLAPQDGNAWAVKSGLVTDPTQIAQISEALQARWGAYGAPAPEAPDAVSPFISGFELETHFTANRTAAALALIRSMWADFMLGDPRMTNSTFIEGYSTSGALHYDASYPAPADPRLSLVHGWSTGPTISLTTYVGGIQLLSPAGATWAIVPQIGDLADVDAGFSTSLGRFSSKWSTNGTVFHLEISTPKGTTGSVGVPLPGNFKSAMLSGMNREGEVVRVDACGRYWINGVDGGDHEFVVVGLSH
ncbi:hypothetical protein GSI_12176 [Ganoderma sinense ZZ0214-1]|uniref:Alpha-L-rhamnosidase six-hairpin glycosidase domain-containing protein n=1 Tax=Ganoderma sinense ZZ0214-1 TaxID=1077348 RepID=A0A2G8RY21_9APHY|nr:hypothetical protein GSI_12176 [Ganoderma sinense ZZ0214-1]